jgi:hypothetical protein
MHVSEGVQSLKVVHCGTGVGVGVMEGENVWFGQCESHIIPEVILMPEHKGPKVLL